MTAPAAPFFPGSPITASLPARATEYPTLSAAEHLGSTTVARFRQCLPERTNS